MNNSYAVQSPHIATMSVVALLNALTWVGVEQDQAAPPPRHQLQINHDFTASSASDVVSARDVLDEMTSLRQSMDSLYSQLAARQRTLDPRMAAIAAAAAWDLYETD